MPYWLLLLKDHVQQSSTTVQHTANQEQIALQQTFWVLAACLHTDLLLRVKAPKVQLLAVLPNV